MKIPDLCVMQNSALSTGNGELLHLNFPGSKQESLPGAHKKAFYIFCRAQRVTMIPSSVALNKAAPCEHRAGLRGGSCWKDPTDALSEGKGCLKHNPPDSIAHDLFRSGLSVPRALSAAQGSVTAPQE